MIVLGLTGSIGMGKSTTARMFCKAGIPVHDSDATVHRLYSGKAVAEIEAAFPGTTNSGGVDREKLGQMVIGNEVAMKRLEAIVHPLVRQEETNFLQHWRKKNSKLVVLDIPLLFETGSEKRVDGVVVVTAPAEIQRERVLARSDMNEKKYHTILKRQYPDADKRKKADFIIDTSNGMNSARRQVEYIIEQVCSAKWQPATSAGR